jgi:hypothetical protein
MTQEIYAWRTPRDLAAQEIEPQGLHFRGRTLLAERVMANEERRNRKLTTHCPRGHQLEGDNLRVYHYDGRPKRVCVVCSKERNKANKVKAKARKAAA